MVPDVENPILNMVGVEHMSWKGGYVTVNPRKYSALVFRISGSAIIKANGNEYNIQPNSVLYLPQNLGYTASYTDTEIIAFHFKTASDDKLPCVYTFDNTERIYKMFLQAYNDWGKKRVGYMFHAVSQLYAVLAVLFELNAKERLPGYLTEAVSIINSSFNKGDMSVSEICRSVGVGETSLRRIFKKYYFKTPNEYIIDLRIDYAKTLILNGESVKSAALQSGFNSSKYFSRIFKKRVGITPCELSKYE